MRKVALLFSFALMLAIWAYAAISGDVVKWYVSDPSSSLP